jgi:hypothetical protein
VLVWDTDRSRRNFTLLQRRLTAGRRLADVVRQYPAHFVAFDVLSEHHGRRAADGRRVELFRQDDRSARMRGCQQWARWCTWLPGDPRWEVTVIDTTGRSVEQTALAIRHRISQARADQANDRLALAPGWANHPTSQCNDR